MEFLGMEFFASSSALDCGIQKYIHTNTLVGFVSGMLLLHGIQPVKVGTPNVRIAMKSKLATVAVNTMFETMPR